MSSLRLQLAARATLSKFLNSLSDRRTRTMLGRVGPALQTKPFTPFRAMLPERVTWSESVDILRTYLGAECSVKS